MSNDTIPAQGVVGEGASLVRNLADVEAIERVPLAERGLPPTTYQALAESVELAPDSPALKFFLRVADFRSPFVWTHRQWLADITRAANLFRRLGIERGDVVAFVLPNLPETHFVIWGGEAAGITFAINPLLEAASIAELLRSANAKLLVTLAPTPNSDIWEKATAAARQVPSLTGLLSVSVAPYVRGPAGVVFRTLSRLKPPRAAGLTIPIMDLRREMAKENGTRLDFEFAQPDDISSYFCTGGTTGLPKIAMRTQFSEVFDCWAVREMINDGSPPGNAIFCGLPLFHVNGQLVTGLAQWMKGDQVVLGTPQGYRAEGMLPAFWEIVEHYKVSSFSGVPTLYASLVQQPVGDRDLSNVKFAVCGAAPMPTELFRQFQDVTGIKILEGYGLTEGACASSASPLPAEPRIGSIGIRLPYQQMAIMIMDEAGRNRSGRDPGTECVRRLRQSNSQSRDLDRSRWTTMVEYGRLGPPRCRRLLLVDRSQERIDHSWRAQHRSQNNRRSYRQTSGRCVSGRRRSARAASRRSAGVVCSARRRSTGFGSGTTGVCPPTCDRARGASQSHPHR
jgi:fatty-acyl-CoA synthase